MANKRDQLENLEKRRLRGREQEASSGQSIRAELERPSDPGWGTSAGAMGRVKMESEEAHLASCPECGYSGGRHSRRCERA